MDAAPGVEAAAARGAAAGETMKAVVRERFGSAEMLEVREVAKPELVPDGVLVRVRAASLNRGDWYALTGTPWVGRMAMGLRRPKERLLGADFAGVVEAVGSEVTDFRPGDEVFGGRTGALAEYVCVRTAVVRKPPNVGFEEAATVPVAGVTALQGLRDKGGIEPGMQVLVNGASGGVGTFAVQIAKALGANVTGVCGTRNVELVRSLGADDVVDYRREDFTRGDRHYDLVLDVAGGRSWSELKRVLAPAARVVVVGAPVGTRLLGPLSHVAGLKLASARSGHRVVFFIAKFNRPDFELLRRLLEEGKLTPVIDRRYELSEVADAFRYLGEGHCRAKVVITF